MPCDPWDVRLVEISLRERIKRKRILLSQWKIRFIFHKILYVSRVYCSEHEWNKFILIMDNNMPWSKKSTINVMMNKYFSTLARMISFIDFIYYKAYSAIDFSQEILMEVFVLCNSSSFSKEKIVFTILF